MSLKTWLYKQLGVVQVNNLPAIMNNRLQPFAINNGVTIYPYGQDQTFIQKGYNKNAWVYSIVSKCAKKFGQVPWYHYKIKTGERKTWAEYVVLTKDLQFRDDIKLLNELKKMRQKSVDQVAVDSPLSKLLAKPNPNQSGAQFREQLYGYKLLTGEGNTFLSRPTNEQGQADQSKAPIALYIIPKQNLALVKGGGPWDIGSYKILIGGQEWNNPKDNIIMWRFPNYDFDPLNLSHLRGQSPLDAGLLLLQASNEGAERLTAMNKNQGVAGLVYNKVDQRPWGPEQAAWNRRQFNAIVNDKELAGQIAYMGGEYGYIQFGLDAGQLKLLEQSDVQFKGLCNIYDVPWQLFGTADSYENRKQYKRDFIYDNIAVAAYGLRDEYNAKLIPEYNLDRDRDVIDVDVLSLPELTEDLRSQVAALKDAWQLTPNQVLEQLGFDRSTDPNMDKVYVPSSLEPMDQLNADLGGSLDGDLNNLNEGL